jgi:cold shock CspA family protein
VANNLSDDKPYGFIEQADGGPDLFFDRRQSSGIITAGTVVEYVNVSAPVFL